MGRSKRKKKRKTRISPTEWFKRILQQEKVLLGILLVAGLMRFVDLGRQGLWVDEMCVYSDSTGTYRKIFRTVHPVTFLLARASLSIQDNEYFLRLPSAVTGFLGVLMIFLIAKELFGRRSGLIAAALLTLSPYHLYYSQDANYYAEMMFFSMLSIWLLLVMIRTKKFYILPLLLISLYITFKTHLFCIFVVAGVLVTFVLWLISDRSLHGYIKTQLAVLKKKNPIYVPLIIIVLIIVISPLLMYFIRLMLRYSFKLPAEGMRAENFEPSFVFFWKLAIDYGIAFQQYILRNYILTIPIVLLFVIGLVLTFRRSKLALFLFILLIVSPFIGLSIRRVQHFYHPRYTSFIVPLYLLCIAGGVESFARYLSGFLKQKRGSQHIVAAGLTALIFFAMIPNLVRYYSGHKQNWKDAVEFLKDNLNPDDTVAVYLYWNRESLKFYFDYFGIDPSSIVKIPEVRGEATVTSLNFLKKLCFKAKGDVYLVSSYTRYEPPQIFDWVQEHFDVALYLPSLHPEEINREGKEVVIYKWRYPDSYILPPMVFNETLDTREGTGVLYSEKLLFDKDMEYVFRLLADEKPASPAYALEVYIDGTSLGFMKIDPEQKTARLIDTISAGVHELEITIAETEQPALSDIPYTQLQVYRWTRGIIKRQAETADFMHPTSNKFVKTLSGAVCFCLKINSFLEYDYVFAEKDDAYYFRLRALNDKPGPVLVEISVDDSPRGILSFDKGDNSWSLKGFPLDLKSGEHKIRLHFLNNFRIGTERDDEDNDAIFDFFELIPVTQIAGEVRDLRLPIRNTHIVQIPESITNFSESDAREDALGSKWFFSSESDDSYTLDEVDGVEAVQLRMSPLSENATLYSVPFNVSGGKILYFSTSIRTSNLDNHSANIVVDFWKDMNTLDKTIWLSLEGITGSHDEWIRYVCFNTVPPESSLCVIQLFVYANSQQFGKDEGVVWFSPIEQERDIYE